MADSVEFQAIRMGGRVVDCTGLENLASKPSETAEMADFCGSEDAQDALFTARSAGCDGTQVGTMTPEQLRAYFQPCLDALEFDCTPHQPAPGHFLAPANHIVYFIGGAGGAIKIGFTQQAMGERLKCIQNGSPVKLEVLAIRRASRECERIYHRRFAEHRLHGEWFSPHPDILAEIERLK